MTLAILSSLDLVVNKTVTVVTVAGTVTAKTTLGNIVPAETVIDELVAPLLHWIVPFVQPVAVSIAVSLPHIEVLLAEICGAVGV